MVDTSGHYSLTLGCCEGVKPSSPPPRLFKLQEGIREAESTSLKIMTVEIARPSSNLGLLPKLSDRDDPCFDLCADEAGPGEGEVFYYLP